MREERVLVVDDDPAVRRMLTTALRLAGYAVGEAANGTEALEELAHGQDVIVLDLEMPGMSGVELLSKLSADRELSQIPVLVVTARDTKSIPGASALIRKPCGVFVVVDAVTSLLHKRAIELARTNRASTA